MSKNIRKRRDKLWSANNGQCHWCGIKTIVPPRGKDKIETIANLATLDHLRTRLDSNRQEPNNNNEERTVLACLSCNSARGLFSQLASLPIFLVSISQSIIHLK